MSRQLKHAARLALKRSPIGPLIKRRLRNRWPLAPALKIASKDGPEAAAQWLFSPAGETTLRDERLLVDLRSSLNTIIESEFVLLEARKALLLDGGKLLDRQDVKKFSCALIEQCILNEYVFFVTDEEKQLLADSRFSVENLRAGDAQIEAHLILTALYEPLQTLFTWPDDSDAVEKLSEPVRSLITTVMTEYAEEREIAQGIECFRPIEDATSMRVASFYETFPYPRWVKLHKRPVGSRRPLLEEMFNPEELGFLDKPYKLLIGGCGTGREALQLAHVLGPNVTILAFDLCMASLSYAKRKARHYGIENIQFTQADIMDLPQLGIQVDMIESTGVLHHMGDPLKGWSSLVECLKPGGVMHISLYSELARRKFVELRKAEGFDINVIEDPESVNANFVRQFRYNLMKNNPRSITEEFPTYNEFFDMSRCRDNVFHVMEHRYTIPKLKECFDTLGLKFRGFQRPQSLLHNKYWTAYPSNNDDNALDKWWEFEQRNPDTFEHLYQMWLSKPA